MGEEGILRSEGVAAEERAGEEGFEGAGYSFGGRGNDGSGKGYESLEEGVIEGVGLWGHCVYMLVDSEDESRVARSQ